MTTDSTMLWTAEVVPPTIKKAWAAPKASAASSSASRITDTGWQRLSRGFMELTSMVTHCSPQQGHQLRVAAAALVAGDVEGHHPHALEPLQRLIDGRAGLFRTVHGQRSPFNRYSAR